MSAGWHSRWEPGSPRELISLPTHSRVPAAKRRTQKIKLHRLGKLVPSNYAGKLQLFLLLKKSFGLSCAWEGCLDGTDINSGKRPFTFVVFGATLILVTEISTKFIVFSNRAKYQFHLAIFMIYHSLSFLVTYRIWITEPGLVSELPTKNNFTIWGILKKSICFWGGLFNWYIFPFLVDILYQQKWLWASGRQSAIGFCWFFLVLLSHDFPKTPIKVRKITSHPFLQIFWGESEKSSDFNPFL